MPLNRRYIRKCSNSSIEYNRIYIHSLARIPITLPPYLPTFISSRWHDEDDSEQSIQRKYLSNPQTTTTTRRRISKRYSDIVGPCSSKTNFLRERYHRSSANLSRRYSLKTSREYLLKSNDFLSHRMQAALSSELMNSLDRNDKYMKRKDLIKRSQTFHHDTIKNKTLPSRILTIPRVKISFENCQKNLQQEIFIRRSENHNEQIEENEEEDDEPTVDYNDESEDEENILQDKSDLPETSASFIVPQLSLTNIDEQLSLSNSDSEQKSSIVLCPINVDNSKNSIVNEQNLECLSSSSPTISIPFDNDSEHRSTSSKIYRDYKQRTSLTNQQPNSSLILHPMHTKISLRSSTTGSSTATINDKFSDTTLISKQMNVCVINQLNEHLTARFRQCEQTQIESNPIHFTEQSYDLPPEFMTNQIQQTNIYDEPNDQPISNPTISSIPPPPPPLPVGGFPPINPSGTRSFMSARTSTTRESNSSDHQSIASSNLSDTRILRELRENPLFTRAKQNFANESNPPKQTETVTYVRLDNCTKVSEPSSSPPPTTTINTNQLETIIMLPNELDSILGKRTQQVKTRPYMKILHAPMEINRQSELELIFQKRAQRSEQNLT